ncbi:MAG TPA: SCO family protein [Isosphaeraceae bacterium]|nr:SCO family protein [Isosphaeraceae bacterium]
MAVLDASVVWGQQVTAARFSEVGFDQNLDAQVPLAIPVRDESGRTVLLGDYFGRKPVILTLNYYNCPMLCTIELNGLLRSLRTLTFSAGDQFEIVTLSIDPTETAALAAAKKASYLRRYGRPEAASGWHFLTADAASIKAITRAVGFRYLYDSKSGQYAHPAGILILTPQGRVARYFYGLEYPPRDLRLGLLEASANKIGSPVDKILLLCFHYDPSTGKYSIAIMNILRALAVLTLLSLGTFMFVMLRRDRQRAKSGAGFGPL